MINNTLFMLGPSKMVKLDMEKEIKVYGRNGIFNRCK